MHTWRLVIRSGKKHASYTRCSSCEIHLGCVLFSPVFHTYPYCCYPRAHLALVSSILLHGCDKVLGRCAGAITLRPKLCLQLLAQLEEIMLCAVSTHWDWQQLPYIQALMFYQQLPVFGRFCCIFFFVTIFYRLWPYALTVLLQIISVLTL